MNDYYFTDHLVIRFDSDIHPTDIGPNQTGGYEDDMTYLFVYSDAKNMDRLEKELSELLHTYINDDKLHVFLINNVGLDAQFFYTGSRWTRNESYRFITVNGHWKDPKMTKEQLKAWTEKELAHIEKVRLQDDDIEFTGVDYREYKVVTNKEEDQFKLMRDFRTTPNGWTECVEGAKDKCINYIDTPYKFSVYVNEKIFDNYDIEKTKRENYTIHLNLYPLDIYRLDGWREHYAGTKEGCLFYIKNEMMTPEEQELMYSKMSFEEAIKYSEYSDSLRDRRGEMDY